MKWSVRPAAVPLCKAGMIAVTVSTQAGITAPPWTTKGASERCVAHVTAYVVQSVTLAFASVI